MRWFCAHGVGHIFADIASTNDPDEPFRRNLSAISGDGTADIPASAVGVGNDPDAVPPVGSANGGSGNTVPLRIIPERSKPPEHDVQSARAKGRDVLDERPAGARFLDDATKLEPETGALSAEPRSPAGNG